MTTRAEYRGDLVFGLLAAGFAVAMATTGPPTYQLWAGYTLGPFLLGAVGAAVGLAVRPATAGLRRLLRWAPIALSAAATLLALGDLAARRAGGDPHAAQMEVGVVERMGRLLVVEGTPYVDVVALGRAPEVLDYAPYSPVLSLTGLPAALFGTHAATDPRWYCLAVGAAAGALALRGLRPGPRVAQLVLNPVTLLMTATSGTDVAVLGPQLLAVSLVARGRYALAGLVAAVALGTKLTAAPVLVVAAVFAVSAGGAAAATRYAAMAASGSAVIYGPVLLADPPALVDSVLRFPAGLTPAVSVAASPLPGYLLASAGPGGRVVAVVVLVVAIGAVLAVLLRRPPTTAQAAFAWSAVALAAAMLTLPASRFGYSVHPLALSGASVAWSVRYPAVRDCGQRPEANTPSGKQPAATSVRTSPPPISASRAAASSPR